MWYMAEYWNPNTENEYERFDSDEEAISGFSANVPDGEILLEIFRCEDDECLTPEKLIWP